MRPKRKITTKTQPERLKTLDGEASKEGFAESQEVPAQQQQQKATLKKYSPLVSNPFPGRKFRGPRGENWGCWLAPCVYPEAGAGFHSGRDKGWATIVLFGPFLRLKEILVGCVIARG